MVVSSIVVRWGAVVLAVYVASSLVACLFPRKDVAVEYSRPLVVRFDIPEAACPDGAGRTACLRECKLREYTETERRTDRCGNVTVVNIGDLGSPYEQISLGAAVTRTPGIDGRRFLIAGYAHIRGSDSGLYPSETEARYGMCKSALWLEFSEVLATSACTALHDFDNKYVWVLGTIDASVLGHMNAFSGALVNVEFIGVIEPEDDRAKETCGPRAWYPKTPPPANPHPIRAPVKGARPFFDPGRSRPELPK